MNELAQTGMLAILTAAVLYETFFGARRYRDDARLLLSDSAAADLERALRSRLRGEAVVAVAGDLDEPERDEGEGDLVHALKPTERVGGRS